jgi:hypothetical protein
MKQSLHIIIGLCFVTGAMALIAKPSQKITPNALVAKAVATNNPNQPKIQVAILLDVSSSMDGLIEQAKTQLWNMVSTMGKAKCANDVAPQIEIALYEYGRTSNDAKKGYVKQINSFMSDLDSLSQNLFSLKTNGGDEYCGQVIYTSINELKWDINPSNYKVIFIAGNEDFLQGNLKYTTACNAAKEKGVIVNTIYCGDKMQGIREHWNLGGECGNGSYTNINQNAREIEIPTPYDSALYVLNDKLNSTYISFGAAGHTKKTKQMQMDYANSTVSKSAGLKRMSVKGKKGLYRNTDWDLVDASEENAKLIDGLDVKTLPDSLQNKTKAALKILVAQKSAERSSIQVQIATASVGREKFIATEKVRLAGTNNTATLETEVEKIIKTQAARFKMVIQ